MIYILSLLLSLGFLYSPKTEKSGAVFITKPLKISYERKTPAYLLFSEAQKVNQDEIKQTRQIASSTARVETLSLNQLDTLKLNYPEAVVVTALDFKKQDLLNQTSERMKKLAVEQQDSTLLNKINTIFKSPFPKDLQSNANAVSVQGYFELTDGVGLVDQKVTVRRVKEGQTLEVGQVDLKAGMYQIFVSSIEGDLVAEIRDINGIIIGEDRKKLAGLVRRDHFFQGPQLILGRPSGFAFNTRMVDDSKLSDSIQASIFSGNYNLKKTTDNYPNVARHSSTVALFNDENQKVARTLTVRSAQDKSETILFNKKWVDGVTDYIAEKIQIQYTQEAGFIIGRVVVDGKPVAGAQVAVENQPSIEPYYLDQFLIPQISQSTTTENGYFVIPGLQEGHYQISAFIQNCLLGTQSYFVEPSIVSYQEISTTQTAQVRWLRSFDAFSGVTVSTQVQIPGIEDILEVGDTGSEYRDGSVMGLIEIVNRPENRDYIPYIYLQNQSKDFVHLPQISEKFMAYLHNSITEKYKIPILPETSVFIGFVQMKNFEVDLSDEKFNKKQIIYFNSLGELSDKPIANGGFLIFNLPTGLQELVVYNKETDRVSSQVFYSAPSRNYLGHFVD